MSNYTFLSERRTQFLKQGQFKKISTDYLFASSVSVLRWPKSVTAISICSRQFQFVYGNFNFTRGNFNFSSNKPQLHCKLYPIREHESRLSIKLRKLQQAKSSRKNTARNNVNLAQSSTSTHSALRINNVHYNDVHRLVDTLRPCLHGVGDPGLVG